YGSTNTAYQPQIGFSGQNIYYNGMYIAGGRMAYGEQIGTMTIGGGGGTLGGQLYRQNWRGSTISINLNSTPQINQQQYNPYSQPYNSGGQQVSITGTLALGMQEIQHITGNYGFMPSYPSQYPNQYPQTNYQQQQICFTG